MFVGSRDFHIANKMFRVPRSMFRVPRSMFRVFAFFLVLSNYSQDESTLFQKLTVMKISTISYPSSGVGGSYFSYFHTDNIPSPFWKCKME